MARAWRYPGSIRACGPPGAVASGRWRLHPEAPPTDDVLQEGAPLGCGMAGRSPVRVFRRSLNAWFLKSFEKPKRQSALGRWLRARGRRTRADHGDVRLPRREMKEPGRSPVQWPGRSPVQWQGAPLCGDRALPCALVQALPELFVVARPVLGPLGASPRSSFFSRSSRGAPPRRCLFFGALPRMVAGTLPRAASM